MRLIRIASVLGMLAAGWAFAPSPVSAAQPCTFEASRVIENYAEFVIGPPGCEGEVGPISFSSYNLPGGQLQPYSEQVLIDHAEGSGEMYGEGLHTMGVSLGTACNWQTDLYRGAPKDNAPHDGLFFIGGGGVAWDFRTLNDCTAPEPASSTMSNTHEPTAPPAYVTSSLQGPRPASTGYGVFEEFEPSFSDPVLLTPVEPTPSADEPATTEEHPHDGLSMGWLFLGLAGSLGAVGNSLRLRRRTRE